MESCDRVGLSQAMQAGDAEKDREVRQLEQRTELMRDAIIYNRNNPSILFYEWGNESISREHMIEMKASRHHIRLHEYQAFHENRWHGLLEGHTYHESLSFLSCVHDLSLIHIFIPACTSS